jgi:hypothetical protein
LKVFLALLGTSLFLVLGNIKNLIVDGDTCWAVKVGEWIWINKAFPRSDSFSWTVNGNPWVAHEWLYDLLLYKLYSAFSYYGVIFAVLIATFILLLILWKTYQAEGKNIVQTIVIFGIVMMMLRNGIVARPHILGFVFFAYFFYVLIQKNKYLWTLPFAALLWANFHGSVVLGILMVFLQLFYETIYTSLVNKKVVLDKKLAAVSVLVPLFSLINPYGIELWKAAIWLITSSINHKIIEWQPPDFKEPGLLVLYLTVIIITTFVCYIKRDSKDYKKIILLTIYLLGTIYEAFSGVRYFPYMIICWGLFILHLLPEETFQIKIWNKRIAFLVVAFMLLSISVSVKIPKTMDEAVEKQNFPIEAVDRVGGRVFNHYLWGGYLIYKDIPVFIDGRADVYQKDSEVFQDYLDVMCFKKDPIDIFDKYLIEQVVMPVNSPIDIYLKRVGWTEDYRDDVAVIYLRPDGT